MSESASESVRGETSLFLSRAELRQQKAKNTDFYSHSFWAAVAWKNVCVCSIKRCGLMSLPTCGFRMMIKLKRVFLNSFAAI